MTETATPIARPVNEGAFDDFTNRLDSGRANLNSLRVISQDEEERERLEDKAEVLEWAKMVWEKFVAQGLSQRDVVDEFAFRVRSAQQQSKRLSTPGEREGYVLLTDYLRALKG